MPAGDVFLVNLDIEFAGQKTTNGYHLHLTAEGEALDPRLAAINALYGAIEDAWAPLMTDEAVMVQARCRQIAPLETQTWYEPLSLPGARAADGMPPQTAYHITQRNGTSAKYGNGSLYLSGVAQDLIDGGRLTSTGINLLETLANRLNDTMSNVGWTFDCGVWSMVTQLFYKTVISNADGTLSNLRSRVGEPD